MHNTNTVDVYVNGCLLDSVGDSTVFVARSNSNTDCQEKRIATLTELQAIVERIRNTPGYRITGSLTIQKTQADNSLGRSVRLRTADATGLH